MPEPSTNIPQDKGNSMSRKIAIYMRVSSKVQDIKSQEPELRRYADAQEEDVLWFSDRKSGKTMDRAGWTRLVESIRRNRISTVVVWRLDRLGRTAKGLT